MLFDNAAAAHAKCVPRRNGLQHTYLSVRSAPAAAAQAVALLSEAAARVSTWLPKPLKLQTG